MGHEMAIRSLVSCAALVDWSSIRVTRWLVGFSLGDLKSGNVLSGHLRCVHFLTNHLISCGEGDIDLAKRILEIAFCMDQIKIHSSSVWP